MVARAQKLVINAELCQKEHDHYHNFQFMIFISQFYWKGSGIPTPLLQILHLKHCEQRIIAVTKRMFMQQSGNPWIIFKDFDALQEEKKKLKDNGISDYQWQSESNYPAHICEPHKVKGLTFKDEKQNILHTPGHFH